MQARSRKDPVSDWMERSVFAGVAQLADLLLALTTRARRRDEEPVRNRDRNEQCSDAFQQLPTYTHLT